MTATQQTPAPPSPIEQPLDRKRRVHRLTGRDKVVIALMIGIPTLIEAVLVWFPAIGSIILSFARWNGVGAFSKIKWIGGTNYSDVFNVDPNFWPAVRHNLIWLAFLAFIATPLGIFFAVLLDRELPGSKIMQSIFFLPVMFSLALVGVIWQLIFSPDQGLINGVFHTNIDWFGNPNINLWAALVAASWKHIGYIMVLYLAGLKGVDPSLREAAAIDGATSRQTFFRVVFPAMRPINIVIVVITVIEALRAFDIVFIINKGTNGLQLLATMIYTNSGAAARVGYASALAVILLVIALVPIIAYLSQAFKEEKR
ncbi:carbohydrate ABC transporter permease [Nakamurella panacisegetis]|uniref:carbohydrate ABC transporter permease n=1 Tax=Nakamurella panacisegetis TaxID=1090615 RepID=UPI0018D30D03|nr:sugar ABC transporter permease [Nakamurella panacisegetis]